MRPRHQPIAANDYPWRKAVVRIVPLRYRGETDLLEIVDTAKAFSFSFALAKAGKSIPARIAMMAITKQPDQRKGLFGRI